MLYEVITLVIDPRGDILARGRQFEEDYLVVDLDLRGVSRRRLHDPRWRQTIPGPRDGIVVQPVRRPRRQKVDLEPPRLVV